MPAPRRSARFGLGPRTGGALGALALLKLGLPAEGPGADSRRGGAPLPSAFAEWRASRHSLRPSPPGRGRVALSQQWRGREGGVEVNGASSASSLDANGKFHVRSADVREQAVSADVVISQSDDARLDGPLATGLWKHAMRLTAEMWEKGILPSATTYAAAITACAEAYQYEAAMGLLEQAQERGVQRNVDVYNAGIAACAAARRMEPALSLLGEMKAVGVEPTAATYHSVIAACQRSKAWRPAVRLLEEMQQRGLTPDLDTFNAAILVCARQQQWEQVKALLEDMGEAQLTPDIRTYESAIYAAATGGHWAETLRLLEQSRRQGCVPTHPETHAFALEACAELQNAALALEILASMKGQGIKPSTFVYESAIRACEQDGQREAARKLEAEKADEEAVGARQLTHLRRGSQSKTNLDWGL